MENENKVLSNKICKIYCNGELFCTEYYNEKGQLVKYDSADKNPEYDNSYANEYNKDDKLFRTKYSNGNIYEYEYDENKELCKVIAYPKDKPQYTYLTINREKNEFNGITELEYTFDHKNPSEQRAYDDQNKLIKHIVTIAPDDNDKRIQTITENIYDKNSKLIKIIHTGRSCYEEKVEYLDNNITHVIPPAKYRQSWEQYDEQGLLIKKWNDGEDSITFEYKYEDAK